MTKPIINTIEQNQVRTILGKMKKKNFQTLADIREEMQELVLQIPDNLHSEGKKPKWNYPPPPDHAPAEWHAVYNINKAFWYALKQVGVQWSFFLRITGGSKYGRVSTPWLKPEREWHKTNPSPTQYPAIAQLRLRIFVEEAAKEGYFTKREGVLFPMYTWLHQKNKDGWTNPEKEALKADIKKLRSDLGKLHQQRENLLEQNARLMKTDMARNKARKNSPNLGV